MSYSTSASPPPSSPAMIRHRSFIHELQAGHNAAEQLRRRLTRSPETEDRTSGITLSDLELAERIFNSFNNSLAIARNCESLPSSLMHQSGEESGRGESSRIKDRRGCYKRRKRGQSWATEGEAPNEDGHAWRKYGQKMILKSKFPRNYYRCTHKTDQGCLAIKQVQKLSDEPPRYKTTYSGVHTCKTPHKTPEIMIPSSSPEQSDSSILLSFDRTTSNPHHISPFFQPSIKEEYLPSINVNSSTSTTTTTNEAMMMNMMMMITQSSTSSDYNYLSSRDPTSGPHLETSDYGGDVISVGTYSCSASPPSPPGLEIDNYMMLEGQDHLDLIQFD